MSYLTEIIFSSSLFYTKIEIKINSDGSVNVASSAGIGVGSPRRNLREFKVFKNGEIEGGAGSLDSKVWRIFQSLLG